MIYKFFLSPRQQESREPYRSLPSKVAQQTLKRLDESWRSFFAALTEWKENPSKFFGRPKLPKYKDKEKVRELTNKRNRRVDHYLHHCSRWIIDDLVSKNIGTLVIGQNKGWKNGINIGDQNNQNFVGIPHSRLVEQLKYKAQLVGIKVVLQEESYTSKASFDDGDPIPTYSSQETNQYEFSGKRVKRGLYRTGKGCLVNADVNGSLNILKKAFPKACEGIKAFVVKPLRVTTCYV